MSIIVPFCFIFIFRFTESKFLTSSRDTRYTNTWIAKIEGGPEVAENIARSTGYSYKGQFSSFENYYELIKEDHPRVSRGESNILTLGLLDFDEVKWAEQQKVRKIVFKSVDQEKLEHDERKLDVYLRQEQKRLKIEDPSKIFPLIKFPPCFRMLFKSISQGNVFNLGTFSTKPAPHAQVTRYRGATPNIQLLRWKISAYEIQFNDPLWRKQWYFQDYRTKNVPVMDHNVVPVYNMKYTGKGVTIGVIDTAIQVDHPDLKQNIDMKNSYDIIQDLPLEAAMRNNYKPHDHGTQCAGAIAMMANNNLCGVGVAYNAKIAAITSESNDDTPSSITAKSLVTNLEHIDIYSNSWGPEDDAKKIEVFDELVYNAYKKGVTEGRERKGVIYVHASGNGGVFGDSCSTDPTINSPFIIGITSANQFGKRSDYAERCTGIFATTYSGNMWKYKRKVVDGVVSLMSNGECSQSFSGTSASTPIAAGLIALMLEANSKLTYRDVMHIIARSAEVAPLADNKDSWYMNSQKFWVSLDFGFGLMNAENMVKLALDWKPVPEKNICKLTIQFKIPAPLGLGRKVRVPFKTDACIGKSNPVRYLEHVEVTPVVEYSGARGDIVVHLTSASKTKSTLLESRRVDSVQAGLEGWSIMTTHNWGEEPWGDWELEIDIAEGVRAKDKSGLVKEFTIAFHGLGVRPPNLILPRQYAAFRLPDGRTELG